MALRLPDFTGLNILIAGDVMLDRYWQGATSRISPEAPVPVVHISDLEDRAGGAGNVALNITALGGAAQLLGVTGNDEAADALQQCLENHPGIQCHFSRVNSHRTITKLRVLSRHQQLIRLDFEDTADSIDTSDLQQRFTAQLATADIVILSDYAKGTLKTAETLITQVRDSDKKVIVDPKGADFTRYRHATVITPNMAEFEAIVGPCRSEDEVYDKGLALCDTLALDALLITRSEKGMTLLQRHKAPLHLPTQAREVYDVTGAGDTVVAVLAAALAAGSSLSDAARLANHAAGIAVGKLGTATISPTELRKALQLDVASNRGVISEELLLEEIHHARQSGETIVMTNGCFDILHAGHIRYLNEARSHGDRLIVAVNADDSVRRLKGKNRPINPLQQRMEVLAGLRSVDWVVPFDEDTPQRLICKLLPDILIKGGDYHPNDIAGGDCVTANGGKVIVTGFVAGQSTSGIIDAVLKNKAR